MHIKKENRFFDVHPRIVSAAREVTIEIRPLFDDGRFHDGSQYEVTYFPIEQVARRSGWPENAKRTLKPTDGILKVRQYFEAEQQHAIVVEQVNGEKRTPVGDFRLYSLRPDLFDRRPYKGDLHMHSNRSDGRDSPAHVAGACRRIGLDFMALTDHGRYEPSLAAIRAFDGVDVDLRMYPGEEVHPPGNPVHIINFGGRFSVNQLFGGEDSHRRQVRETADRIGDLPPDVDPHHYASCVWCFDKIRQAGGLAMFSHPYWEAGHTYTPPGPLTDHLFATHPFDCYEVIGGYGAECDSNSVQIARYEEERAKGTTLPIAGVSDAHGCETNELFGWYYTVVFSPSADLPDLIDNIKDLYSVAVECLPNERPRVVGTFRLGKYALFLIREIFPQHDELCFEEGRLMLAHAAGAPAAAGALHRLRGRTAALSEHLRAAK